jgi:hypothetical protein
MKGSCTQLLLIVDACRLAIVAFPVWPGEPAYEGEKLSERLEGSATTLLGGTMLDTGEKAIQTKWVEGFAMAAQASR